MSTLSDIKPVENDRLNQVTLGVPSGARGPIKSVSVVETEIPHCPDRIVEMPNRVKQKKENIAAPVVSYTDSLKP